MNNGLRIPAQPLPICVKRKSYIFMAWQKDWYIMATTVYDVKLSAYSNVLSKRIGRGTLPQGHVWSGSMHVVFQRRVPLLDSYGKNLKSVWQKPSFMGRDGPVVILQYGTNLPGQQSLRIVLKGAEASVGADVLDSTHIPWFNNMALQGEPSQSLFDHGNPSLRYLGYNQGHAQTVPE